MTITNLEDLQKVTNLALREAMANERSRRWAKVVQSYHRLLRMLRPSNLPKNYDHPPWLATLYYELYYHLGIALQHVKEDKRAVAQYTKAIEVVSIPKGGCLAGCNSNSCLMTPLYARRAMASARAGELRGAIKDAEKAVVLDSNNPDVYCIRSLARATRTEEKEALKDAESALELNPNHPCALILRGTLIAALSLEFTDWDNFGKKESMCPDHAKACSINPDCHNFLAVHNFNHPDIPAFYDRFLYSLNIPHTISEVVLVKDGRNQPLSREAQKACATTVMHILGIMPPKCMVATALSTLRSPMKFRQPKPTDPNQRPFRCGTPTSDRDANVMRRRREYGDAVRQHCAKSRSVDEFIAWLENSGPPSPQKDRPRPVSAGVALPRPSRTVAVTGRPFSAAAKVSVEKTRTARIISDVNISTLCTTRNTVDPCTKPAATNSPTLYVDTPHKINYIQVFRPMNLEDAPRMYYKPWKGDRLPVAYNEAKDAEIRRVPFK